MATFTRRHYNKLAESCAADMVRISTQFHAAGMSTKHAGQLLSCLVKMHQNMFATDNPKFDSEMYEAAVFRAYKQGMKRWAHSKGEDK